MDHPGGQMPKTHDFYSIWPKITGIWHPRVTIVLNLYNFCGFILILQAILYQKMVLYVNIL